MDECLCYSIEKGLYIKYCSVDDRDNDILVRAWDSKGYKSKTIKVEEENLLISIHSNLGYGRMSYLYATISKDAKSMIDYDTEKISVLNNASVSFLCVKENEWHSLFNKLIKIYNNSHLNNILASAIGYIDALSAELDKHEIYVKSALHDKELRKWKDEFLIVLHCGDKITDFLDGIEHSGVNDETVIKHSLLLCEKWLNRIRGFQFDLSDSRTSSIAKTLLTIHVFMDKNNKGIEFLNYYQSQYDENGAYPPT